MIKIEGLNFSIDNKNILNNINMKIDEHKFVGIIGENGCGKSTLLKNIYRNYKPEKNKIFLSNVDLNEYTTKGLAEKISVLSQNQKINFDFSVREIIEMGRYTKSSFFSNNNSEKEMNVALKSVGMEKFKDHNFLHLSGGEMQRVLIARSIAQESDIILLDEPTNHLDIRYQYQIMDLVKKLKKTIVAVIHDINIASKYCDYIFAIKNGEIIYEGEPKDVITEEKIKEIFDIDVSVIKHPKGDWPVVIFL